MVVGKEKPTWSNIPYTCTHMQPSMHFNTVSGVLYATLTVCVNLNCTDWSRITYIIRHNRACLFLDQKHWMSKHNGVEYFQAAHLFLRYIYLLLWYKLCNCKNIITRYVGVEKKYRCIKIIMLLQKTFQSNGRETCQIE